MPGIFQSLLSGPVLSWQITLCSHSHIHTGHTHTPYSHTTAWIKPWSGLDSRKGGLILLTCIRDWPQESPMWLGVKGSQPEGWSWPAAIMLFLNLISDQRHAYHICSSICETDLKTGTTSIANSLKKCWNYGIPGNCHFHKCSNVLCSLVNPTLKFSRFLRFTFCSLKWDILWLGKLHLFPSLLYFVSHNWSFLHLFNKQK